MIVPTWLLTSSSVNKYRFSSFLYEHSSSQCQLMMCCVVYKENTSGNLSSDGNVRVVEENGVSTAYGCNTFSKLTAFSNLE